MEPYETQHQHLFFIKPSAPHRTLQNSELLFPLQMGFPKVKIEAWIQRLGIVILPLTATEY